MTHVLVVDDDPNTCRLLCEVLAIEGFDVSVARDRREGVSAVLQATQPLVVILDYVMPYLTGNDAVRLLATAAPPPVPIASILMASEYGVAAMKTTASEATPPFPTLDLVKPFDFEALVEVVGKAASLVSR